MRKTLIATLLLGGLATPVLAQNVYVTGSRPVDSEIMPALGTTNSTLGSILSTNTQIGGAVTTGTDKIAAMIQESITNQQQYSSYAQESQNLEHARQSYTVPASVCSDSASGQAAQIAGQAAAKQSALAGGGGIKSSDIKKAFTEPAPPPEQDQYAAADNHGNYCSAKDQKAYGELCKPTDMPGGDTQISSVLTGAGPEGKAPDLTFSQDQTDAAMQYMKNSSLRVVSKQLQKGEVKTDSGKQYVGLMAQYDALQSAAEQPQLENIANSQPNDATKDVLAEDLQTPSAKAYYDDTASAEAKRTGKMSQREFEAFEVGRRYASTDYLTDLGELQGDNLLRESIKIQNLQNWLILGLKQQIQEQSIILGQQLSLRAADTYGPQLQDKLQQVTAGAMRK